MTKTPKEFTVIDCPNCGGQYLVTKGYESAFKPCDRRTRDRRTRFQKFRDWLLSLFNHPTEKKKTRRPLENVRAQGLEDLLDKTDVHDILGESFDNPELAV